MNDKMKWESLLRGEQCPFDVPRSDSNEHWDKVGSLSVSTLYLHKIQTYRGYSLLVLDRHATRLDELREAERSAFMADLNRAQEALRKVVRPDHMNLESLGNAIPHLHWHIIPRYKGDPRWGLPIWMATEAEMPQVRLAEQEREVLLGELRDSLAV
jgi:diadenosine tetraphosphate (Ap4A) HIT family hydrolase